MVAGAPFEGVDAHWLVGGDRVDQHLGVAVLDVAHIITVHALHEGDRERARTASEVAILVAPHDEVPLLDLVAVRIVDEELRDYWVDEEPPLTCRSGPRRSCAAGPTRQPADCCTPGRARSTGNGYSQARSREAMAFVAQYRFTGCQPS
jgi:hypothetical protein